MHPLNLVVLTDAVLLSASWILSFDVCGRTSTGSSAGGIWTLRWCRNRLFVGIFKNPYISPKYRSFHRRIKIHVTELLGVQIENFKMTRKHESVWLHSVLRTCMVHSDLFTWVLCISNFKNSRSKYILVFIAAHPCFLSRHYNMHGGQVRGGNVLILSRLSFYGPPDFMLSKTCRTCPNPHPIFFNYIFHDENDHPHIVATSDLGWIFQPCGRFWAARAQLCGTNLLFHIYA